MPRASRRSKTEAAKLLTKLAAIVSPGAAIALRMSSKMRGMVVSGGRIDLSPLKDPLADAMTVAYLTGRRRSFMLAGYDDALAAFAKTMDRREMDRVRAEYNTKAFDLLNESSVELNDRLRNKIGDLIRTGSTTGNAIKQLRESFDSIPASRLETLFRTNVQLSFGAGRWDAYQDPAVQEILWGYEYVTAGDDRVREEHDAMDGVRWKKDDPRWSAWWPPNGWNCRCQVIAVFDDDEQASVNQPREVEGSAPKPDPGFQFNPSTALNTARAADRDNPTDAVLRTSLTRLNSMPAHRDPTMGTIIQTDEFFADVDLDAVGPTSQDFLKRGEEFQMQATLRRAVASQDGIRKDDVERFLRSGIDVKNRDKSQWPKVTYDGRRYVIHDGHHRMAAALLLNQPIDVLLIRIR